MQKQWRQWPEILKRIEPLIATMIMLSGRGLFSFCPEEVFMQLTKTSYNTIFYSSHVLGPVHSTPEEFENGGFTPKTHQMFFVHTRKRIKCFPVTLR